MHIDIPQDKKIRLATAVWQGMLLSNFDELKKMKEPLRIGVMRAILTAIQNTIDPDITYEILDQEADLISKYTTVVYEELLRMQVIIKGEDDE